MSAWAGGSDLTPVAWCVCGMAYPAHLGTCPDCGLKTQDTFVSQPQQVEPDPLIGRAHGVCHDCGGQADFNICANCLMQRGA